MAGIQALDPFNRPSDGLQPLRDDEAENLLSEITLLSDTPTGSSTQPKKIRKKNVHNLGLLKKNEEENKLTNPYISLERSTKRGTISQK